VNIITYCDSFESQYKYVDAFLSGDVFTVSEVENTYSSKHDSNINEFIKISFEKQISIIQIRAINIVITNSQFAYQLNR